jgi:amino acid transporter
VKSALDLGDVYELLVPLKPYLTPIRVADLLVVGGLVTTQTPQGMFDRYCCDHHSFIDRFSVQPKDIIFQKPNEENWFGVLMASIFLASFSYVGVEVVAATAQEAKGGNTNQSKTNADGEDSTGQRLDPLMTRRDGEGFPLVPIGSEPFPDAAAASSIRSLARQHADADTESEDDGSDALSLSGHHRKSPFQSPARYVPIVSAVLYLWGAWIVTQNVAWDDPSQPSLAGSSSGWSSSIFINSARKSSVPGLDRALTGLLIVNIASTSSTALYVASRTLFGLTFTISKDMERKPPSELWRKRWLDFMKLLSRKSKFDVPYIAVLVSAWGLILPFLKYAKGNSYLTVSNIYAALTCILSNLHRLLMWSLRWDLFPAYSCGAGSPLPHSAFLNGECQSFMPQ